MDAAPGTFCSRLSDGDWNDLRTVGSRRHYPAGTTVFSLGDEAHEVMILLAGQAKATVRATNGREVILGVMGPGSLLGEVAAIDGGARSASIVALADIEVLAVRSDSFDTYLIEHPTVLRDLAMVLASRLRQGDRSQLDFGAGDSLGRLCRRLIELADRHGRPTGTAVEFDSPLSQTELGAWCGVSREAIVKAMKTLRDLGWVENEGSTITLLHPDEIRNRSNI